MTSHKHILLHPLTSNLRFPSPLSAIIMVYSLLREDEDDCCIPNLLCDEDSSSFNADGPDNDCDADDGDENGSLRCGLVLGSVEDEEAIIRFMEEEGAYLPGRFHVDGLARKVSVSWMIKVSSLFGFQPSTVCLAVNYMDRFLSARCLPDAGGWPLQLLSVACLSLAAKMEEPLVPSLLDIQVESAKFIFEPRTICRMEVLVLTTLDWKLRSITPFHFIDYFASKADLTDGFVKPLVSRATQVILFILRETKFLEYWPSSVAAAVIFYEAKEIPCLSNIKFGHVLSCCDGLHKDQIVGCSQLLKGVVTNIFGTNSPKVLPQLRVMARKVVSPSDSSSFSPLSINKRRRLE